MIYVGEVSTEISMVKWLEGGHSTNELTWFSGYLLAVWRSL